MLKSILAATLLTSVLASGAIAATPATKPVIAKPATVLIHKASMKKMMMKHHCAKGLHMVKGKCVK
jgi:hypothetical protein